MKEIFKRQINKKTVLILIILLAAFLRFWHLGSYPALNADEAAIGYNAYSLIQTGKDEHDNPWPIHFQSFNDYKPGLYFYLVLPFVKILGLNEWAVRIPGASFGVLTVIVIYLLVKELFKNSKEFSIFNFQFSIAEIAALFLAISPWHIHFSRGGWEVNVATFFITAGVWLFLKALNNPKYLGFSVLSFALSLYTYHAARVVAPLLTLGLVIIYRGKLFKKRNFKFLILNSLFLILLLAPLAKGLMGPAGFSRAAGVGLFADPGPLNRINEQRGEHANYLGFGAKALHNKAVNYGLAFGKNWAQHFWGEFLFLSGDDIQRNKVPETGQMYWFDLMWLVIGAWWLVRRFDKKAALVLWWLAASPVAAALTFQSPHALRAQNMVIPLVIIAAAGLSKVFSWLSSKTSSKKTLAAYYMLLATLIAWQFARYEHMYWVHMAKEYPFSSQYGVKELVNYVKDNESKYDKIIVTNRYDQPYILFLFYLKYPPEKFQTEHELTARDVYGFSTVENFDKYYFQSIIFDEIRPNNPNSLIIGTDEEIPDETNIIKRIYGTNGYLYFEIVGN